MSQKSLSKTKHYPEYKLTGKAAEEYLPDTKHYERYELESGAVICTHEIHSGYHWHTLYYKPQRLQDMCVNHYIKRYMKVDKTELTDIPNWQMLCGGKYKDELDFVMLLCKENVGE